jgi:single-strand DNA-binding protein
MSDTNNVTLIGRLTRDADLKYTTGGTAVTKFSIAVNKRRKSGDGFKDEPHFFEIVLWGKLAESLKNYLSKGKQIAVSGELTQERWEQNGENRSKVTVTAASIQLLGGGSSKDNAGHEQEPSLSASTGDEGYVDDIPF